MPIYEYRCACGWSDEEVFRRPFDAPDTDVPAALRCPRCSGRASRATANRFAHDAVVFDGVERYERALLQPKDRMNGARFSSMREIRAYEEANGLRPIEPGTAEWKTAFDSNMDDARSIEARGNAELAAGGTQQDAVRASADYVAKTEVQAATGWSSLKYDTYQEQVHAAERLAHDNPAVLDGGT